MTDSTTRRMTDNRHMNPYTIAAERLHWADQKEKLEAKLAAITRAEQRSYENEDRWWNESGLESYFRMRDYRIRQALRDVRSVLSSRYDRRERKWKRGPRGKQPKDRRSSAVRVFDVIYREWQPAYDATLRDESLLYAEPKMPTVELSLAEIARKVKLAPRSVSDILTKIERLGFVKRHEQPGDLTAYEVVLPCTPTYVDRLKRTVRIRYERLKEFQSWLTFEYTDDGLTEAIEAA